MYICECGKEFNSSQQFNGHKGHCRAHYEYLGKLDQYEQNKLLAVVKATKMREAHKISTEQSASNKINLWLAEQHTCETCGKIMTDYYGTGRFCSSACAHHRILSTETKQAISTKLRNKPGNEHTAVCAVCGKEFIRPILKSGRLSRTTVCSEACAHSLKVQRSIESMQKLVAEGRQVPWQSRNIKSYAEKFFEQVLDTNNIVYKREVVVAHDKSNYFLDFVIETKNGLIDLEIDGKQHQYKERKQSDLVRDAYLTGLNYSVYRIPWNEITSETGKTIMKEKIDKFLVFYNSLI